MTQFDFTLHDYLHLRLVDASQKEADVIHRQLGPIAAPFSGRPDLTVRFTDPKPEPSTLRYIGLDEAAYDNEAFFVLKGKNKARVKVRIPFDQIGQQPVEIQCERRIHNIPLLVPLINLVLLSKGILPFHASAFNYQGKGVLVTGWAKGGKTETLLAFLSKGAKYVGDEWVYLYPDGAGMFGIPEPIRVWNWHLESLPHLRVQLQRKDKNRLALLSGLHRTMAWVAGPDNHRTASPARLAQRLAPIIQRQMFVHLPPHVYFGKDRIQEESPIDHVFFTASHNREEIIVEPMDVEELAQRMIFSLLEEQHVLASYYRKYRFAFPERPNHWLDQIEQIQMKLLTQALKGKKVFAVYHPYPVHIPRLYEAVEPYLE